MVEQEKKVYAISDKIICLAEFTKNILLEDYNISENKIYVVPNGLKNDIVLLSQKDKRELKNKHHIRDNEKIILFVGRLDEVKGVDIVIKAFRNIIEKNPDRRLIIVGDGNFSRYLKECQDIWDKIIFTGRVEKETLYQFYQIADVGVMPSTHEQCSYVAIEMLAHGIPLIVSTTTGLGEMLNSELNHLKLDAKEEGKDVIISVEECTNKILYILNQSESGNETMRKQCRKQYLDKYMIDKMKDNLLSSLYSIQ